MVDKRERNILKLIKFVPITLSICLSLFVTYLFILSKSNYHEANKAELKKIYIKKNKQKIKDEVYRVYDYINYETKNAESYLKKSLKERNDEVYNIVNSIYKKYRKTHRKKTILKKINDFLNTYRFNEGRGYFYIYDLNGTNLIHPIKKHIVGKNVLKKDFSYISEGVRKIFSSFKNKNETFCEIKWDKPGDTKKLYDKITYNRIFKPYNIVIGTGEYLEEYEDNLKKRILKYLNHHTYSKNGYVFIIDYKGRMLSHFSKKLVNVNRINFKNIKGVFIIKDLINIAKKGEDFYTYVATVKPQTGEPSLKTSFIKGFDKWQWAIGTGFYIDEVDKELNKIEKYSNAEAQKDIINIILLSLLITIFAAAFSIYISSLLKKMFLEHKEELLKQVEENRKKDSVLAQQSKMAAMGEMIQNISHQWRQPLSAISTVSSGLKIKKQYGTLEDEDFDKGIEKISFHTQYLSQTIDDFRDYFNPSKEIKAFSLKNTIDKSLKLLDVQLSENNIEIIDNIGDDVTICTCESMLMQVFINLFSNSKDEFIKNKDERHCIFLDFKEENNESIILIKDNAGGIAEENLEKIFEIYFSTKEEKEGSGIGLYMVSEIIKKLNAKIEVRNEDFTYEGKEYKGAVFEIRLASCK
ncbi:MAG: cache domain-containing protein [Arcobacter sp.]|nr:cache domain-containing protein [Arcobacter sp.]